MDLYYDLDGNPITQEQWLNMPRSSKKIASTSDGVYWISTVWLGLNHAFGGGKPLIFESMVFGYDRNGDVNFSELDCRRYSTKEEALVGHEELCEEWLGTL